MRNVKDDESCPHRDGCAMYSIFERGGGLAYWRERYCDSEYSKCARFEAMKRGDTPPVQLLPSGRILRLD